MGKVQIPSNLMQEVAKGDHRAFRELYDLTSRPVYSFLLSLTMDAELAKDLMQETYLKVYRSAGLYKDNGNPMAWIMKISKNLFLMERRKAKPAVLSLSDYDEEAVPLSFSSVSDVEVRIFLEELFSKVTEEERNIVILHVMAGFKHREIADLLEMPLGTVLSKYNRAMKKLNALAKAQGGIKNE